MLKQSAKEVEFEDGLTVMTLPELRTTLTESQIGMGPERMDHYEFIDRIGELASKYVSDVKLDPIFIRSGGPSQLPNVSIVKREAEQYDVDKPIEAHLIRKLVTKINLDSKDEDKGMSIAIGYNQRGYQVAYGVHVFACANMSIWGDNYLQTYGNHRTEMPNVFERIESWMISKSQRDEEYLEAIEKMRKTQVNQTVVFAFVGFLLEQAVKNAEDALKINQVSNMARNIVKAPANNVWELYNHATNTLNPQFVRDFEPMYRQNIKIYNELVKFVEEVEVPKVDIIRSGNAALNG